MFSRCVSCRLGASQAAAVRLFSWRRGCRRRRRRSPGCPTRRRGTPASRPVAVASAAPSLHVVNPGDTLMSIAHRNHISVAELAKANNLDTSAKLKLGMRLNVPTAKIAGAAPVAAAPVVVAQPAVAAMPAAGTKVAAAGPQQSARLAQASPAADGVVAEAPKAG